MSFGYSTTEFLQFLSKCNDIRVAFGNSPDSASAQVVRLAKYINRFGFFYKEYKEQASRRNSYYVGHDDFEDTIKECMEFVEKYSSVVKKQPLTAGGIIKTVRIAWWDEAKITKLQQRLDSHISELSAHASMETLRISSE